MRMSYKVPKLKKKEEEEDDDRVAVIDTGMFSVKVSLQYENVYEHLYVHA